MAVGWVSWGRPPVHGRDSLELSLQSALCVGEAQKVSGAASCRHLGRTPAKIILGKIEAKRTMCTLL